MEVTGRSLGDQNPISSSAVPQQRLLELSSWMMVLGTIRWICSIADSVAAYLETFRPGLGLAARFSLLVQENNPIFVLSMVWPLLLALALRRTRWPELLWAAGITFLILSIEGVLEITVGWNQGPERWYTVGSFHVSRHAFLQPSLMDVVLGLVGVSQLLLELWTAVRAIQLALQTQALPSVAPDKQSGARRARFGRLAVYTSLAYLVLMIRLPVWSAYLEVLDRSRLVREFILQNDLRRVHSTRLLGRSSSPDEVRSQEFQVLLGEALQAWQMGRFLHAKETYLQLAAMVEQMSEGTGSARVRGEFSQALNNLAWLLATCPEVNLRNSKDAVDYARRAVEMSSNQGMYWNTLGVAYYRAGDFEEAKTALYRSMELRNEGDSFDWFFLALIHSKQGHKSRATEWYDKAVEWSHQHQPGDDELYRFQVEAAEELGFPRPERLLPPPNPTRSGFIPSKAFLPHRRGRNMDSGVQSP
jgi:tetratricopeptide (TPR) repeat protein